MVWPTLVHRGISPDSQERLRRGRPAVGDGGALEQDHHPGCVGGLESARLDSHRSTTRKPARGGMFWGRRVGRVKAITTQRGQSGADGNDGARGRQAGGTVGRFPGQKRRWRARLNDIAAWAGAPEPTDSWLPTGQTLWVMLSPKEREKLGQPAARTIMQ